MLTALAHCRAVPLHCGHRPPLLERSATLTQVKICGLTNLMDAETALAAGADMLGFICYPKSRRYITVEQIAAILDGLRRSDGACRTVGVFVDAPLESVQAVLDQSGLDLAQLHGGEPPVTLERLGGRGFKALRPHSLAEAEADAEWYTGLGPAGGPDLLIDAYHPTAYGGTGLRADWQIAATVARSHRLMLAGGLTPDNVSAAIAAVRPWGVDVSSGVETRPGQKDHNAMRAFIAAAKEDR